MPSAGKEMVTVFWHSEDILFVNIEHHDKKEHHLFCCIHGRTKSWKNFRLGWVVFNHIDRNKMFCCCTTMRDHIPLNKEVIRKFGWTTLSHPSYSPDLAPSNYYLFGNLQDSLHGTKFEDDDSLVAATKQRLRILSRILWSRHTGPSLKVAYNYVEKWNCVNGACINTL